MGANKAGADTGRGNAPFGLRTLVLDVGAPVAVYYGLHALGVSDYLALTASAVVVAVRLLWTAVRQRSLNPVLAVLLVEALGGLAASLLSGDARFLLAKDSAGTTLIGLAFLVSLFLRRPLVFHAARRYSGDPDATSAVWEQRWSSNPAVRRVFRQLTALWGIGLLAEGVLRVVLVYQLPVEVMTGLSAVLKVIAIGGLCAVTVLIGARAQRRAAAAQSMVAPR